MAVLPWCLSCLQSRGRMIRSSWLCRHCAVALRRCGRWIAARLTVCVITRHACLFCGLRVRLYHLCRCDLVLMDSCRALHQHRIRNELLICIRLTLELHYV